MIDIPNDATAWQILFTLHDPITGEACDADSLPTVAFRYTDGAASGTATEVAGTVARISTGLYALSVSMAAYYSSPGGAGDYAEASSNVAARVVFPGASVPVCTVLAWSRNAAQLLRVRDSDNLPMLDMYDGGGAELSIDILDASGFVGTGTASALPSSASWTHVGYTIDGTDIVPYGNGVADGSSAAIAGIGAAAAQ